MSTNSQTGTGTGNITKSHNAYESATSFGGVTNVTLSGFTFAGSKLGPWYQSPTNLSNVGSRTAANAGLYHHTTVTAQTKEGSSVVDVGFHYVATDSNGLPLDADSDGIPDYLEDRNGNGSGTPDSGETDWDNGYNSGNSLGSGGLFVFTLLR